MMTNAANQSGEEVGLGRGTLTTIGRHLGAMYEDVMTGELPSCLADALGRLRAVDDDTGNTAPIDHD